MKIQKWFALTAAFACSILLLGNEQVSAQAVNPEGSDSFTVTAENEGVFTFTISETSYDFGTVNANGDAAAGGLTGTNGVSGAVYEKTSAATFEITSAPERTVRIFNASSSSTIVWGVADRLEMQVPTTGLEEGTSCGYVAFSDAGDGGAGDCDLGNLYHSLVAGLDAEVENGQVDLKLTVPNTDLTGSNSWTVNLTASAL